MSILLNSHFSRARSIFKRQHTTRGKERTEREREKKESRRLSDEKKVCSKRRTSDNNLFFGKHLAISGGNTTCLFAKGKREREKEREVVFVSDPFYEEKREREGQNAVKKHPRFPRKKPRNAREREKAARRRGRFSLLVRFVSFARPRTPRARS